MTADTKPSVTVQHSRPTRIKTTLRLTQSEADEADRAAKRLGLTSRNEFFLWLHRGYMKQREDFEDQMYALVDSIEEHMTQKLQVINTATQMNAALLDAFIKYVVTMLPDAPEELLPAARHKGIRHYEKILTAAAKEFRVRRVKGMYEPERFQEQSQHQAHEK